eukprot:TRINITY_DN59762_c0_g1_i1.p1 TRINITY_DN59762_c0_g1~~TRINITY_DN59762_c0_g1_i1.p1  ORF type:complete len:252 (+),score=54.94 TRINITY_DN59762_c0_g1_i1:61-816(+)
MVCAPLTVFVALVAAMVQATPPPEINDLERSSVPLAGSEPAAIALAKEVATTEESLSDARTAAVKAEEAARSAATQAIAEEKKVEQATREARSAASAAAAEEKRAEGAEEVLTAARERAAQAEDVLQDAETMATSTLTKTASEQSAPVAIVPSEEGLPKSGESVAATGIPKYVYVLVALPFLIIAFACREKMRDTVSVYAMALAGSEKSSQYIGGDDFYIGRNDVFNRANARSVQPMDVESQINAMCGSSR